MIFGITLFTFVHVVISLVGITSGFVVVWGMLTVKRLDMWTAVFLLTTVLTSVTGFFFPVEHFKPSHAVGIMSLLAMASAIFARYARILAGAWRTTYAISAVISLYFNVFVLVAQSFDKVQKLKAMAPTQSEPPFLVAQVLVLGLFVALGILATIRFRNEAAPRTVMA